MYGGGISAGSPKVFWEIVRRGQKELKMKKIRSRLFLVLAVFGGLLVSSVQADLGLQQIMASQGASAVGQTVLAAAKAVYAGGVSDPAAVQNQLIAILNEAAATGNEQIIRYAVVAVMIAGGVENLDLSKTAINNSNVFNNYEALTAVTVAATETLLKTSGGAAGNGEMGGSGGTSGAGAAGGGDKEQGGGSDRLFHMVVDPDNPFTPGTGGGDGDLPATRI